MARRLELSAGMRFGEDSRLEVVREVEPQVSGGQLQRCVECRCDCGEVGVYRLYSLRNGNTRSCGCLAAEAIHTGPVTHGGSDTPEYHVWCGLRCRCTNPNGTAWDNYGGRGITVCERWMESFPAFLEDMGRRPSDRHSIDRIDNDGNYEPGNCRWATSREQMRNTRVNYLVEHNGETKCVAEWAEQYGMSPSVLYARLVKLGWTFEQASGRHVYVRPHIDPLYRTPMKERGPGWHLEHERLEVKRIAKDRKDMELNGEKIAKIHRVDALEFKSRVGAALVEGWTRNGSIWRALHEMGAVECSPRRGLSG